MRFSAVLIAVALTVIATSCSEKSQPKADAVSIADGAPKAAPKASAKGSAKPSAGQSTTTIPKGAQWTILCAEVSGEGHVARARQLKENLVQNSGMRDWHLLHKDDVSVLYYGYYKSYNDPRSKADRERIDQMADANGRRPFRLALITPLDAADPAGPPEWNLRNAKGYWSLQIAAYKDSPERKQYALDAVKAAREQGIEAYYYHGESMSLVCVGAWPREAVQTADENVRAGDGGQPKVVLPPLPPDAPATPEIRETSGRRLHVEAGRNTVVDPTLKAAMDQFPDMATNGATMLTTRRDPRTGQVNRVADMSFPVRIPRGDSSILDGGAVGGDAGGIPLPPADGAFLDANPTAPRTTPGVRRSTGS
jgi:hypothetical protein